MRSSLKKHGPKLLLLPLSSNSHGFGDDLPVIAGIPKVKYCYLSMFIVQIQILILGKTNSAIELMGDLSRFFVGGATPGFGHGRFFSSRKAGMQGLLSKLVADTAPAKLRGTGFGIFNLVRGGALLLASVIAGALWSSLGPSVTFLAGAAFAAMAAIGCAPFVL